jgi:hypothetical protein
MLGRKDKQPPKKVFPTTIAAALDFLEVNSAPEVRSTLRDLPADDLSEAYRNFGMSIRASLGLWGENPELIALLPEDQRFADNASMFILEQWQARLRGDQ